MSDDERAEILEAYSDNPSKQEGMRRLIDDGWHHAAKLAAVRVPAMPCCKFMPWDCECPRVDEDCGHTVAGPGRCGDCFGGY